MSDRLLFFLCCFVSFLPFENKISAAESHIPQDLTSDNHSLLQDLTTAAHQGNALSQFMLGSKYLMGNGVKKDGKKAFEWFQKAAAQGHAAAQLFLGKMYANGTDIEKNDKKAFEYFQKAANQGQMESQFFLGKMYLEGKGIEKNDRKAFEWFEKAAEEGHGASRFALGKMYAEGKGVEKNEEKAFEWLTGAAEQGYPVVKSNKTPEAKDDSKTFRKLLQKFQCKKEIPADAHIRQLSSFRDALSVLENLPLDALVIFDLDETLVVSRDDSLPPALTESFIAALIKRLQKKGIKTIALTNSMTSLNMGDSSQEEFRYKELLEVGIDFSKSFQEFFIFNDLPLFEGHYPLLSKGIIYTNSIPKGKVLSAFLEKMKGSLKPSLIIFFDDRLVNILDLEKTAKERNIQYIGFLYNRIMNWLDEGMSYEDIQVKLLQSQKIIHPKAA